MKRIITKLALFVFFTIVFSSFTGCKGTSQQANANNAAAAPPNAVAQSNGEPTKSSNYPLLVSGIADANIELLDSTMTKVAERKGKVILLNLWGIWCGPCRAEMPALAQLQAQYGEKGFEVIGLNIGDSDGSPEGLENIKKFSEQMNLNYTLGRIDRAATNQFYLLTRQEVVPQSVLVTRDGHLRGVFVGGGSRVTDSIKETVEKAMNE
ncbi:MAG: TlpA disulfide reductase family protein [Pyrinomonadaceae bacterium]